MSRLGQQVAIGKRVGRVIEDSDRLTVQLLPPHEDKTYHINLKKAKKLLWIQDEYGPVKQLSSKALEVRRILKK